MIKSIINLFRRLFIKPKKVKGETCFYKTVAFNEFGEVTMSNEIEKVDNVIIASFDNVEKDISYRVYYGTP